MTSPRQTAANRKNAQRSTGPRTAEGRARSAMNALKHGLRARAVLLDGEDEGEFRAARAGFLADLAPRGFLEEALADNVVATWWQLKRAQGVEATVLDLELVAGAQARNGCQQAELAKRLDPRPAPGSGDAVRSQIGALLGDEANADARAFNDLVAQERALELLRDGLEQQPGHAFARDAGGGDVLAKLSRYLTAAQRRFHAALREFERVRGSEIGRRRSEVKEHPLTDPGRPTSGIRPPASNRAGRRRARAQREAPR